MSVRTVLLLALFLPHATQAQKQGQALIDSLLTALPRQADDSNKVLLLYSISHNYCTIDGAKGAQFAREGLRVARQLGWQKGITRSFIGLAINLTAQGHYPQALRYLDTAWSLSLETKDLYDQNITQINQGNVYNLQGNYAQAMQCYETSIRLSEVTGDSLDKANCAQNIGNIYLKMNDGGLALGYFKEAFPLYASSGNQLSLATNWSTQGDAYLVLHQEKLFLTCHQKALALFEGLRDNQGIAREMNVFAVYHQNKGDRRQAMACYQKGLKVAQTLGDNYFKAVFENNMAALYLDEVRAGLHEGRRADTIGAAMALLSDAIRMNRENGTIDLLQSNYENLSEAYALSGDFKASLDAYKQLDLFKDSIFNFNNKQSIQQLADQHEIDLRDKQIQINQLEISNQKTRQGLYIVGLTLLCIVGILFYMQSRNRQRVNTKLKRLNTQLDEANQVKTRLFGILSHDLRSPIANLVNFLFVRKEAPDLLSADSAVIRQQQITTAAENLLHTMEDLLFWSKGQMSNFALHRETVILGDIFDEMILLYPSGTDWRIDFQDPQRLRLQTDRNYLKTILRNLTTNAIKAVGPQGQIHWKAWRVEETTYLSITDNGPGISEARKRELMGEATAADPQSGLGLHLIKDCAAAIGATIRVDSRPGTGSVFTLVLH